MNKYLSLFLFCLACQSQVKEVSRFDHEETNLKYASRFSVQQKGEDVILTIDKPWQGSTKSLNYYLHKDSLVDRSGYKDHLFIQVPISSFASNSTTHLGLLEVLGVEELLTGFAQTKFIYSPQVNSSLQDERIIEIGTEGGLNVETILALNPDVMMAFSSGVENQQLRQLRELGINVVMNADYLETSVLGRAEWIKFFGFLVGKEKKATDYFDQLVVNFDTLKSLVKSVELPTVLSGTMYGSTWFLPGGRNYNAQLLRDAGAQYLWADDLSSGWLNLDFETVYEKASEADFWIGVSDFRSLEELNNSDSRYADFKSYQTGNVYTYTNRVNAIGASDYFESGNVHPDRLLADHIKILHPELLPDYQLYYYRKLD